MSNGNVDNVANASKIVLMLLMLTEDVTLNPDTVMDFPDFIGPNALIYDSETSHSALVVTLNLSSTVLQPLIYQSKKKVILSPCALPDVVTTQFGKYESWLLRLALSWGLGNNLNMF